MRLYLDETLMYLPREIRLKVKSGSLDANTDLQSLVATFGNGPSIY